MTSQSQTQYQTPMYIPIPPRGTGTQYSGSPSNPPFDPSTYARHQQSHHASVLTKVLAHSLSILPPLEPHTSRSDSMSSSSTSPRSYLPVRETNEVAPWDYQGMMKDFGGNVTPFQYDPFASFPMSDQIYDPNHVYNPTQFVNPDWLHKASQPALPLFESPDYTSSQSLQTEPSLPSSPNPFDGTCHILHTEDMPELAGAASKKRKYTKQVVVDEPDSDSDVEDDDELVEMNENDILGPSLGRKNRRRVQNRLAQRAFRARSKITRQEAACHLQDLEDRSRSQASKMNDLTTLIDKLQRENTRLKCANWDTARESGALGTYMTSINAGLGIWRH